MGDCYAIQKEIWRDYNAVRQHDAKAELKKTQSHPSENFVVLVLQKKPTTPATIKTTLIHKA